MTHQPVNYLITARPHIISSQPGHSSQDSPCQPASYLIRACGM